MEREKVLVRQGLGRRVDDAKSLVLKMFLNGGTDADTATACLLALDLRARERRQPSHVIPRRRAGDWHRAV